MLQQKAIRIDFQMLNTMCAAGMRLAQSLYNLSQLQNVPIASQCITCWEDLTRATAIASSSVKNHISAAMQDMSIGDTFAGKASLKLK